MRSSFQNFGVVCMVVAMLVLGGCVSWFSSEDEQAPIVTDQMPLEEAIDASIRFGGGTLASLKQRLRNRNEWQMAAPIARTRALAGSKNLSDDSFLNAVNLYQSTQRALDGAVFVQFVNSERSVVRQAGWQLLANMPEAGFASAVDQVLSTAVENGQEQKHFLPQMADAVRLNRFTQAYTFLRVALMRDGDDSYAKAMATLDPYRASDDFLDYLALASPEELRQMSQSSIKLYTGIYALKHFLAYPADISHRNSEVLFYYAVSRNTALSELSQEVLQFGYRGTTSQAARILSRLPVWVQVSFVESVRRSPRTPLKVLVSELRIISGEEQVIAEIEDALR